MTGHVKVSWNARRSVPVALIAVIALFWPAAAESPPIVSTPVEGAASYRAKRPDVRVSVAVITAHVDGRGFVANIAPRERRLTARGTPVRKSGHAVHPKDTGIASRASRLLLGDGRHKPQPFPTVR